MEAQFGKNVKLGKYVVIEEGCQIGDNAIIDDFVVLKSNTIIGDNCCIHAGAKIGVPVFDFTLQLYSAALNGIRLSAPTPLSIIFAT
jgi:UDP-3-O-[3-hydroxymyristoyl] glucosamine N-acyltransferase